MSGNPLEADFGAAVIGFNENPQKILKRNLLDDKYKLGTAVVSFSEALGKLQFFTNGGYVLDTTFTSMKNEGGKEVGLSRYDGNVFNPAGAVCDNSQLFALQSQHGCSSV